jgi:hypothetical protein
MVVGAQKAGTSSLIRYLGEHPRVCTPTRPEMNFFTREAQYRRGYDNIFSLYFGSYQDKSSIVMAKQAGLMYLPEIVNRLKEHNPHMRLVAMLRNPVDRAYSAYWHYRRAGRESLRSFEGAIEAEPGRLRENFQKWHHCAYLDRGVYYKQIISLYDHFPKHQIHIFLFDDFKSSPVRVCRSIYGLFDIYADFTPNVGTYYNKSSVVRSEKIAQFLNSDNSLKRLFRSVFSNRRAFYIRENLRKLNEKEFNQTKMNPETRTRLVEYFRPHNEKISRLLNRDLSHWNK